MSQSSDEPPQNVNAFTSNVQSNPPQGAYGQGPYQFRPEHPRATAVLIMGILGFFIPIVGIVALIMGYGAKREIESGAPYGWEGSLKVGWILGWITTILQVLSLLLGLLFLVVLIGIVQAGFVATPLVLLGGL